MQFANTCSCILESCGVAISPVNSHHIINFLFGDCGDVLAFNTVDVLGRERKSIRLKLTVDDWLSTALFHQCNITSPDAIIEYLRDEAILFEVASCRLYFIDWPVSRRIKRSCVGRLQLLRECQIQSCAKVIRRSVKSVFSERLSM